MDLTAILSSKEAIAAYIAIAGVVVSSITYIFNKKQLKQNQLSELIKNFNQPSHREARKVIYDHSQEKQILNRSFQLLEVDRTKFNEFEAEAQDALIEISKNIVRSDLNYAGTLVRYKMIESNMFIDEYWWIILNSWNILENDIKERRNNGISNYMRNFEDLKIMAEKFVKKNHPSDWKNFQKSIKKTE